MGHENWLMLCHREAVLSSKVPAKGAPATPAPSSDAEIDSFLEQVRAMPRKAPAGARGRLIFSMDATMSRQPTWDRAQQLQARMFLETEDIGGLDVQLVFYRGFGECKASRWVSDGRALAAMMSKVDCRGGHTQIGRVLGHVLKEARKGQVSAVVHVGDACEENIDDLAEKAGEIGLLGIPVFMFQEGSDPVAAKAFSEIARLSGGAHCRFDEGSAARLRELLSAVAVYAAGGVAALEKHGGAGARLLLGGMGR